MHDLVQQTFVGWVFEKVAFADAPCTIDWPECSSLLIFRSGE